MENNIIYSGSVTGRILKGTVQENYTDSKGAKKTMIRLSESVLPKESDNFTVVKTTVNYREFATTWARPNYAEIVETLAGAIDDSPSPDQAKLQSFLLDVIANGQRAMLGDKLRKQPDAEYIDLSFNALVDYMTTETKRGRQAQGFSGEDWKLYNLAIASGLVAYVKTAFNKELSTVQATVTLNNIKATICNNQSVASDNLITTLKGIRSNCTDQTLADKLGLVIEAKESLSLAIADLDDLDLS